MVLYLGACRRDDNFIHSEFQDLSVSGLEADREYLFYPFNFLESSAKDSLFNIFADLRYTDRCSIQQLTLKMEYSSLSEDSIMAKNFTLNLFEDKEGAVKKGKYGIFEQKVLLLSNQKYEEGFFVSLSSKESIDQGIISLGIIISYSQP